MDANARIDALEDGALHLAREDAAKDLVLAALIATHPDPAALKSALQSLLAANELKASETGFQKEWRPEQVKSLNDGLRPIVERWIGLIAPA